MSKSPNLLTPAGSADPSAKCQICRLRPARYTCPVCNLRYCTLDCFRSEEHSGCSENFYKESLISEVSGRNDVDQEEKAKVMDMLKRLQENDGDELGEGGLDGIPDEGDLESALEGLDIDGMSAEELLAHLSPEQRAAFEEFLKDPLKAEELLQASKAEKRTFWWQTDELDDGEDQESDGLPTSLQPKPIPLNKGKLLPVRSEEELQLSYNLLAVLLAYSLHHHLLDSDATADERQKSLAELLPFIVHKSEKVFTSATESMDYVLANVRSDLIANRRKLMLLLLEDAHTLLWSPRVTLLEQDMDNDKTFLALSDLYMLFSVAITQSNASRRRAYPLAGPKLLFYASNLGRIPRRKIVQEVASLRTKLEREERDNEGLQDAVQQPLDLNVDRTPGFKEPIKPKIEEIS